MRSSRVRLCSLFPAPIRTFLPPLPSLIGDLVSIGLVSISTDLVSVTVSGGWLPLAELPWIPVLKLIFPGWSSGKLFLKEAQC